MIAGKEFGELQDHVFIIYRALDLDTLALPTLPVMIQTLTTAVHVLERLDDDLDIDGEPLYLDPDLKSHKYTLRCSTCSFHW